MTVPEPGFLKDIVETIFKPFTLIFNPIAERIGNRLKRKPKLYVHIIPMGSIWNYAWNGNIPPPIMQVRFDAHLTNDSEREAILILDGYVEGTTSTLPFGSHIEVPPHTTVFRQLVVVFCMPVVGEGGRDFTGRIVFVDQLKRKHRSDVTTFKWAGTTEPPKVG